MEREDQIGEPRGERRGPDSRQPARPGVPVQSCTVSGVPYARDMSDELRADLAAYDRAVYLANETYRGMSVDERAARGIAARHLAEHAPEGRSEPACAGCDGGPWPCGTVRGAMVMADPRSN